MFNWRKSAAVLLDNGEVICLVCITKTEGSTPRNTGAVMLVTAAQEYGTIGGGNLEMAAINTARECLRNNTQTRTLDYILGPDVEQCCGGRVELSLQTIANKGELPHIENPAHTPLYLFGAGHVGTALIQALFPLPFQVFGYDTRLEKSTLPHLSSRPPSRDLNLAANYEVPVIFNAKRARDDKNGGANSFTQNTIIQNFTNPKQAVLSAPKDTAFLIMTHDHSLDYQLVSAVLTRNDFTFLGLIGSKTKRARFMSRLKKDGFADAQLSRLTCPIGIEGIQGKEPEIIAASVAAQLLQLRTH